MLWVLVIVALLVVARLAVWWRDRGHRSPEELHRRRGQKFGVAQARDQGTGAYDTLGLEEKNSHLTDPGK